MILHNYKTSAGKDLIFEYIDGLAEDERRMLSLFLNV